MGTQRPGQVQPLATGMGRKLTHFANKGKLTHLFKKLTRPKFWHLRFHFLIGVRKAYAERAAKTLKNKKLKLFRRAPWTSQKEAYAWRTLETANEHNHKNHVARNANNKLQSTNCGVRSAYASNCANKHQENDQTLELETIKRPKSNSGVRSAYASKTSSRQC